jgi:flagellar hook protein FlgE
LIDQSGALVPTSNATDIAVRGRGFFPVTDLGSIGLDDTGYPMHLATTGSFRLDEDGYLRTSTGVVLMGWPALEDGTIPTFPRDTPAGLKPVQIPQNAFVGEATTELSLGMNLPATDTMAGAPGTPRTLSVEYFDNLGISRQLTLTMTPTVPAAGASNEWTLQIADSASGGAVVGEYTLTFNDTRTAGGSLATVAQVSGGGLNAATGVATINVGAGPIEISLGTPGTSEGMTQLSNIFAPTAITKNGSAVGNMIGVEIDEGGYVLANFDTGVSRRLYQVPILDVGNPNQLVAMDNQTYAPSAGSGGYFRWDAGDGPTGELVSNALEASSTDVAGELTNLIQTQRAYSSNAKVIQTVDEMLQETTNIKR